MRTKECPPKQCEQSTKKGMEQKRVINNTVIAGIIPVHLDFVSCRFWVFFLFIKGEVFPKA